MPMLAAPSTALASTVVCTHAASSLSRFYLVHWFLWLCLAYPYAATASLLCPGGSRALSVTSYRPPFAALRSSGHGCVVGSIWLPCFPWACVRCTPCAAAPRAALAGWAGPDAPLWCASDLRCRAQEVRRGFGHRWERACAWPGGRARSYRALGSL